MSIKSRGYVKVHNNTMTQAHQQYLITPRKPALKVRTNAQVIWSERTRTNAGYQIDKAKSWMLKIK